MTDSCSLENLDFLLVEPLGSPEALPRAAIALGVPRENMSRGHSDPQLLSGAARAQAETTDRIFGC